LIMKYPTISLCMIVKNEEEFLPLCLESVKDLVDEIIIVDTGSEDRTPEIAGEFGAGLYNFQWCHDFSLARNFSLEKASKDWILIMDADEVLDRESIPEIKKAIARSDKRTVYFLNIINYLNEEEKVSNSTEVRIVRLIPNNPDIRYRKAIHEEVYSKKDDLKRLICNARIFHRGYTEKIHKERNKGERNVNLLLKCIEKEPENPFFYYHLGVSYYVQNRLEECIEAFKKSQEKCNYVKESAYLPSCYSLCAAALSRRGRPEEGKEQAETAIEISPYFYEAYFNLGKSYLGLKETEKAKEAFEKALECSEKPQFAVMDRGTGGWKALCELGLIYLNEDNPGKALKYFNRGLDILPSSSSLLINAAHCYRKLGFFDFALRCFEKARQKDPSRLDIFYDITGLYDKMGLSMKSVELFEEILHHHPSSKELFHNTAKRFYYLKDYKEAIYYFTETLVLDDEDPEVYFYRARCYWHLGATKKAKKDLEISYELKPDLFGAFTLYDFIS